MSETTKEEVSQREPAFIMVQDDDTSLGGSSRQEETEASVADITNLIQCPECLMKFSRNLFEEHYVKHTGDRPFECEICHLKFSHKFALRAHKRSHDPEYQTSRSQQTPKSAHRNVLPKEKRTKEMKSREEIETDETLTTSEDENEDKEKPRTGGETESGSLPSSTTRELDDQPIVVSHFHVTGEAHQLFLLNKQPDEEIVETVCSNEVHN